MAVGYIRPASGLSAADRALLVPENIRSGVSILGVVGAFPATDVETKTATVSVRASGGAGGTTAVTFGRTYLMPPAVTITALSGSYADQFNHRVVTITNTGCVLSWGYGTDGSGRSFTNQVTLYITGAVL